MLRDAGQVAEEVAHPAAGGECEDAHVEAKAVRSSPFARAHARIHNQNQPPTRGTTWMLHIPRDTGPLDPCPQSRCGSMPLRFCCLQLGRHHGGGTWADGGAGQAHGQTTMEVVRTQDAAEEREGGIRQDTEKSRRRDRLAELYSGCSMIWGMRDASSGFAQDVRVESAVVLWQTGETLNLRASPLQQTHKKLTDLARAGI